jgi:uncharacterized protein (DUF1800 family)
MTSVCISRGFGVFPYNGHRREAVKRHCVALLGVLAFLLAGCTGLVSSGGSHTPPPPGQLVVSPASATIRGGASQTFSAQMNGAATAVSWSVNGVAGGNAEAGMISAGGVYTAPEFPPSPNSVTVGAVATADSSKTSSSSVTLSNPVPQITSISPTSIQVGTFNLTVNGAHFANGATISFGSSTLTATRVSSTQLTATGTATSGQVGNIAIAVKNPDPGSVSSGSLTAQIVASNGISVQVTPATVTLHGGTHQFFTATVNGSTNQSVTWSVNNVPNGNPSVGNISSGGDYAAPSTLPTPNTITVTATSVADATKSGTSMVTLQNPIPVLTSVTPSSIGVGSFLITLSGTGFVNGATVNFGGQVLTTMFVSPTELTATGTATASQAGSVQVTVTNPNPGGSTSGALTAQVVNSGTVISAAAAVRFLEQSSFGPSPEQVNQLQQTGFDPFLQSQFAQPVSMYPAPAPADMGLGKVQQQFFFNAVNGTDQLRQRTGFALNELWVVGENKVSDPTGYTNYIQTLENDGLGNYYNVMRDVTLTPAMGHWLDMVNNDKPATGQHANENYARELMQLFTLGLNQLNPDGTPVLDGSGNPIPTYTQDDVMALGRSLTGWTYPTQAGMTLQKHNPEYYGGPMVAFESNHDGGAKTFLGQSVAAGQSSAQELDSVLTIIFNHPNLPPFVCRQLIEKLVTSNPSPAYVQRASQAFSAGKFNAYGSGKRGDMQATIAAILLDPEARRGDSPTTSDPGDGKLREPIVMMVSIARAFHAGSDGSGFESKGAGMSQDIFNSGSVFNFFPPDNLIPQTTLNGPEFAIFNTNTSLARVNFVNSIVYGSISSGTKLDFSPVITAGTPDQMVAWLNNLFLHGTMSDSMKQSILTAISAITVATPPSNSDLTNQAKAAIYLVTSSTQYQVQR